MSIEEFSKHIYEEMETLTEAESDNSMEATRRLYFIILKTIIKLRDFFIEYQFESKSEEINFLILIEEAWKAIAKDAER
ncbi:MAG: hypothetical protein WKF59_26350 [Chitinophagaceae bacterium]